MQHSELQTYRVWGRDVRAFHWINLLSVLALLASGVVIYNGKALGISGEAKLWLKAAHVWCGYLFTTNLLWRLVQGFRGSHFARWRATLPLGRNYLTELGAYLRSLRAGEPRHYLGHNPLGRVMIGLLFLLLLAQALSGLVLAATDLYYPPLGGWIAEWVAAPGLEPASLVPADKSMVDAVAWQEMRDFRSPFIKLHVAVFFVLLAAMVLHVAGVVVGEFRERAGLVSAMITGSKALPGRPVDLPAKLRK